MALRPSAGEVSAVVEILETEHDSPQAMARAIVAAVFIELQQRTWFVVAQRFAGEDTGVNYGPFPYRGDASSYGRTLPGEVGVVMVCPPTVPDVQHAPGPCGRCRHPKEIHADAGRCGAYSPRYTGPRGRVKPNWNQCPCDHYEKGK